jgi:hypothetical protein
MMTRRSAPTSFFACWVKKIQKSHLALIRGRKKPA